MNGDFDYVIVGSGAGGGPLAANLAKSGFKVLLMEAGGDPCSENETGRLMYQVPIFHGISTEYAPCSWEYYVRHYTDDRIQARDLKKVAIDGKDWIWYPRAGALGGCTTHNAMIMVVPQDSDWDHIAEVTRDESWRAANMRKYFQRLESCKYTPAPGSLLGTIERIGGLLTGHDSTHGHGFEGWLPTSEADPKLLLRDLDLLEVVVGSAKETLKEHVGDTLNDVETWLDPNDARHTGSSPEGLALVPLTVDRGKRVGPREYLLRVREEHPENLTIRQHALVTKVIFEGNRAVGVEFIDKAHIYRADPQATADDPGLLPRDQVRVRREVILAGGAFNSPQLLMLSGVGPREQLERWNIPVVAELKGVGQNLQDRYEVGVISEFERNFVLLGDESSTTFAPPKAGSAPDHSLAEWESGGKGLYASNGALIAIIKRSLPSLHDPDLFIFGLPSFFRGYEPGWSTQTEHFRNRFTWAVLKARTNNRGCVTLASDKPWDRPAINFQYFGDGQRQNDPDLEAAVNGVKFARAMNQRLSSLIREELAPGPQASSDDDLREFVRTQCWGHHASCTNKMGADDDPDAVLDSRFRVRKTEGLRVVDASVFPKIPGYFIVSAVYMASEKAADVIREDAR